MRTIVGVMGSGHGLDADAEKVAHDLGRLIAEQGWVLLNGGRDSGVMDASSRGAKEAGGLTVGVLPDHDSGQASPHIDIPIRTGMGHGRNVVNVLSSDVVIALPGLAGTLSEVALALKAGRTVIALGWDPGEPFAPYRDRGRLLFAETPEEAVALTREELARPGRRP